MSFRVNGNEEKYLLEVLSSDFRSSSGSRMTKKLEAKFAEVFDSNFAISFSNGTATMHAALEAAGVGPGDEVIVPPLTMSSTTFAVLQANATPIFADVDRATFQISAESIKSNITPRTKAVITVSLYGLAPDLVEIRKICDENGLFLLEDNAECYLSEIDGRKVGTFGDAASYSFQSSKHLTSGEGGMIICDDENLADKIRRIQSLGYAGVSASAPKISKNDIQHPDYSRHVSMGWNYRLGELPAAVALAQLERIDELVSARVEAAKEYNNAVEGFEHILTPQFTPPSHTNSYWTWTGALNLETVTWEDFRRKFLELGGSPFYAAWKLTYLEPMFTERNLLGREKFISNDNLGRYSRGLCPNAEWLQKRICQFKTNLWSPSERQGQAEALRATLEFFNSGK